MRKLFPLLIFIAIFFSACSSPEPQPTMPPTYTPTVTLTATITPPAPAATETPTPDAAPPTPTATPQSENPNVQNPATNILILQYDGATAKYSDKMLMNPTWLDEQMSWLSTTGYHTLTAEELAGYIEGTTVIQTGSVALTFNLYLPQRKDYNEIVIPKLRQYGLHAIFFLRANNQVVIDDCNDANKFCWSELRQWADEGLVSYGSYGISYVNLGTLSLGNQRWELDRSRSLMEEKLGLSIFLFAHPFDNPTSDMIAYAPQAGYRAAFSGYEPSAPSVTSTDIRRYYLPRLRPYSHPALYPQITGMGKSFQELLALYTGYNPAGLWLPTPIYATDSVDMVKKICFGLTTDLFQRGTILENSPFTPDPSAPTIAALPGFKTIPSCNFVSGNHPEVIVLHYSEGGLAGTLSTFWTPSNSSAHYLIDKDGTVIQMVPETLGALHANCNSVRSNCVNSCPICDGQDGRVSEPYLRSISIEIINNGRGAEGSSPVQFEDFFNSYGYRYWEDYTPQQLASLKILVYDISARWGIPVDVNHVIGHYRINPRPDPGPALNLFWARQGYPPADPIFP